MKLEFYKLQASGNDFILIDSKLNYKNFARKYCNRKLGIGADGLLVIEPSGEALFKMRIFNADGSEAEMCGNGARCAAFWLKSHAAGNMSPVIRFETKAGIIKAQLTNNYGNIKLRIPNPSSLKLNIPLKVLGRNIKANYINTGVPHAVVFVEGLEIIDVEKIGKALRFHKKFSPRGANVNFVEIINENSIKVRTYERGVEAETLACGTGGVAAAIITYKKYLTDYCRGRAPQRAQACPSLAKCKMNVLTKSGEALKVYFDKKKDKITNVWLEGRAQLVYRGEILC